MEQRKTTNVGQQRPIYNINYIHSMLSPLSSRFSPPPYFKQENRWKRRMLPKWLLSIQGKTCNPTPLVHQDMTKKRTFYETNIRRDNSCKVWDRSMDFVFCTLFYQHLVYSNTMRIWTHLFSRTLLLQKLQTTLKRFITCINRCERPCFNRYRPQHFC